MAGILNFPEFKKSFLSELDPGKRYSPKTIKTLFEKAEFQNQSEYDSRCRECGCKFHAQDFTKCPECNSGNIERNLD